MTPLSITPELGEILQAKYKGSEIADSLKDYDFNKSNKSNNLRVVHKTESLYPKDPFSPLKFLHLPQEYNIHATEDQYNRMNIAGAKMKKNHPDWPNAKLMRKVFELFPSVKISVKHESISGAGTEDTSGYQRENSHE